MNRDVKIALQDSKDLAKLGKENQGEVANRVIASLYIRSVIRGNDALCLHFLKDKPRRHGQASNFFSKLYEENIIDEKYSRYKNNIATLDRKKSEVEYQSVNISKKDLKQIQKQAERFLENVVEELLDHDS